MLITRLVGSAMSGLLFCNLAACSLERPSSLAPDRMRSGCEGSFDATVEELVETDSLEEGYELAVLGFGPSKIALVQEMAAVVGTVSGPRASEVVLCMATGYAYRAEVLELEGGRRMLVRVAHADRR